MNAKTRLGLNLLLRSRAQHKSDFILADHWGGIATVRRLASGMGCSPHCMNAEFFLESLSSNARRCPTHAETINSNRTITDLSEFRLRSPENLAKGLCSKDDKIFQVE